MFEAVKAAEEHLEPGSALFYAANGVVKWNRQSFSVE